MFETCGEIVRISLPKDHETGTLRGFGYIEFKSVEAKVCLMIVWIANTVVCRMPPWRWMEVNALEAF